VSSSLRQILMRVLHHPPSVIFVDKPKPGWF
jgi:hypothetical protein